jgi:transposase-like protein
VEKAKWRNLLLTSLDSRSPPASGEEDYAMQDSSPAPTTILQFRQDIQARLRERVREAIEATLDEELTAALGSVRHERTVVRRGYRHGAIIRTVTTAEGTRALEVPRGRVRTTTGTKEFRSEMLPRYARRTRDVDDALLACYGRRQ